MAKASKVKHAAIVKFTASVQGVSTASVKSTTLCIPSVPSEGFATDYIYDFNIQEQTTNRFIMNNNIDEDTYKDSQQAVLKGGQDEGKGKASCKLSTMAWKRKIVRFVQSDTEEEEEREQKRARQESGSGGDGKDEDGEEDKDGKEGKDGAGEYSDAVDKRMDNEGKADNHCTNKDGDYRDDE